MTKNEQIMHLRWNEKYSGKIRKSAISYFKKYGRQRTLCWLAPSINKKMTDDISKVTCKRCLASIRKRGYK